MSEMELSPIVSRLETVERSLQTLTQRLHAVEQVVSGRAAAQTPPPPPIISGPIPTAPRYERSHEPAPGSPPVDRSMPLLPPIPVPAAAPRNSRKLVDDLEYKIGLTGLLRGGAVVIVIAIIYLVALAISKGYITPQVQFAGEIVLCLTFVTLGIVKRTEKEEFGQLMVGIGSCGLYLTFAGGHLYKQLYAGETLVGLFVALSFVNLAFSWVKSSRSFLAIGMLGGLTAAMLPMHQYKPTLDVGLQFLILVPTALIVVKRQWKDMAVALWAASTAALIPALTYNHDWMVRLGGLYGTALVCAATYALVWTQSEFDPWCGLSGVFLVVAGIAALVFDETIHGSLHVLVLAGGGMAIGLALHSRREGRNALWMGSLALAATLSPIGFHRLESAFAYAALSIALAAIAYRFTNKALVGLSVLELALGLCAYTAPWASANIHFGLASESWLLVAFMASTLVSGFASVKSGGVSEHMMLVGSLVGLPLFSRLGFILLTTTSVGYVPTLALLLSFLLFAFGLIAIAYSTKWLSTLVFAWISLGLALMEYVYLVGDGFYATGFDSIVLLSLMTAVFLAGLVTREKAGRSNLDYVVGGAGALIGIMVVRMSVLWLTIPSIHWSTSNALILGLLVVCYVSCGLSLANRWKGLLLQGWVSLLISGAMLLVLYRRETTPLLDISCLVAELVGVLAMAKATMPYVLEKDRLISFCSFVNWVVFSRLGFVILTGQAIGLKDAPALTLAWIIYAIALIVLGFRFQVRALRYWSFGVFAATLIKIFIYDLSELDPGVRVLLLLVLGIGMVGGGYWYIRTRATVLDESVEEPEITGGGE